MLSLSAVDRILNPKTAHRQVIGSMTVVVGGALMENLVVDKHYGFFVNHDLANYEVPGPRRHCPQEAVFFDETDPISRR